MSETHRSKPASWATVAVLIVAFVLLGFSLPMQSAALAVTGAIVLVIGVIMLVSFRVMEDFH